MVSDLAETRLKIFWRNFIFFDFGEKSIFSIFAKIRKNTFFQQIITQVSLDRLKNLTYRWKSIEWDFQKKYKAHFSEATELTKRCSTKTIFKTIGSIINRDRNFLLLFLPHADFTFKMFKTRGKCVFIVDLALFFVLLFSKNELAGS